MIFRVDQSKNQLDKLTETRFSKQKVSERNDFQEWLANTPNAMGEELLIIQKEFDGFENSRKRLDLLALDKEKRLVVIENKLDDSGQDVTWQVVQYAASVASLTTKEIIDIFQMYLDRFSKDGNAAQNIRKFLGMAEEESEEIALNPDNNPRLFLIARKFRIEVTNTVLWLRKHGIDARCYTIAPYTINEELLLDIQLIIPTPETEDFMVRMAKRESEAKTRQDNEQTCFDYWKKALDALNNEGITLYQNISPSRRNWLYAASGLLSSCGYSLLFLTQKKEIRVQLYIGAPSKEENKRFFDFLHQRKEKIEAAFGDRLRWRLGDGKSSRIQFSHSCDARDREKWPEYIDWHVKHIKKLEGALRNELTELRENTKN